MKKLLILGALALTPVFASTTDTVAEERNYYQYQELILGKALKSNFMGIMKQDQSLYVDALEDVLEEMPNNVQALNSLESVNSFFYELADQFRVDLLKIKYNVLADFAPELIESMRAELSSAEPQRKLLYLLAANESLVLKKGHGDIIELAKMHKAYYDIETRSGEDEETVEPAEVYTDLFYATPDVTTYMNGEYVKSVKIFKFCRTNRLFPCLMVMKDIHDQPVRNANGELWVNPSLASSSRGLPSYSRNGNTPAGIFTIDSVMPVADQQISYGKNRRMILNFVPAAQNESLLKSLLPPSSQDKVWWKESAVARDIGRNLFRIHGTGKVNNDPNTPYFPFMRTSGCIAQRENTYAGTVYRDQRNLLDTIMKAMELEPKYENEIKIKGIVYLIELNEKNEPVSRADLLALGIN